MSASLDYIYQPDVPVEIIPSHDSVFAYTAKKVISTAKYKQLKAFLSENVWIYLLYLPV